ncbi:MAG: preprotein translocase subunit SecY [Ruminococcus sp.]|nr:preprotein translocase subunit SecY [Ruminococcus sp.]MEE0856258.1 preprotein translocase subunit SecY [Ruminococcus sp.]
MFKTIRNAWSIPDLRKKLLFTLLIIIVFRIGSVIPVPFLDQNALAEAMKLITDTQDSSNMLAYLNTLSGGAFSNATLFAMGITPYINSSIIIQLLCVAIPPLERLTKEGEAGRRKIGTITRYVTVALGLIQGTAYFFYLKNTTTESGKHITVYNEGFSLWFSAIVIVLVFTAGTALMMWLGEQINKSGIGNGISILLFAGIIARLPATISDLINYWNLGGEGYTQYYFLVPLWVILFLAIIWLITFMQDSERRIPIQYAKRVVGRKMYGGQSSHLPIKVALGGVLPIIFASSILSIPGTINLFLKLQGNWFFDMFNSNSPVYITLYFLLIIMFAYFYTTIQYNPIEMANNLKANNGTVPGIRPGAPTAEYIKNILSRITLIGALFLAVIALVPHIYGAATGMGRMAVGGTSVIILVGVALDTVKQLESQMMMRHYKGFLD